MQSMKTGASAFSRACRYIRWLEKPNGTPSKAPHKLQTYSKMLTDLPKSHHRYRVTTYSCPDLHTLNRHSPFPVASLSPIASSSICCQSLSLIKNSEASSPYHPLSDHLKLDGSKSYPDYTSGETSGKTSGEQRIERIRQYIGIISLHQAKVYAELGGTKPAAELSGIDLLMASVEREEAKTEVKILTDGSGREEIGALNARNLRWLNEDAAESDQEWRHERVLSWVMDARCYVEF